MPLPKWPTKDRFNMMWGAKNIGIMISIGLMSCTAMPLAGSEAMENINAGLPHIGEENSAPNEDGANSGAASTQDEENSNNVQRNDFWLSGDAQQGAVLKGLAPTNSVALHFNETEIPIAANGLFLIGFDRDAPLESQLIATLSDGRKVGATLTVQPTNWQLERVNTAYYGGAKSSDAFQQRRGEELSQISAARKINSDSEGWKQDFIWPVKGRLSGLFGRQRIYQGKPGSYHGGMDIAVPTGTKFVAPADGVVILAADNDFTLEGKLLMIDHGNGLNSAFLHSSALMVKTGDVVKQGQVIGLVGATGRASGPHLHWGMKWNAARVDPKLLLPAQ